MRRTKIVCTLGPATSEVAIIKQLIQSGMDAARINFSHGTYATHTTLIENLKQAREELNMPIPLILDTKGPEIRIRQVENDKVYLSPGSAFTLTTDDVVGTADRVSVNLDTLPNDLSKGSRVLIDDGLIELSVEAIQGPEIACRVINGGYVCSNKGVNVPDVLVDLPSLTQQDIEDIRFGIQMGFDYVAASFVRSASDVVNIRRVLEQYGGTDMHIIAKIENREGVKNIMEILEAADSIMVARGDLGVEIPPEEVPLVQKKLIRKANQSSRPVITATQMLESMVVNPRPTRAEANDVANAIFDGSDAIMLSGETAKGNYPVEAVAMMAKIAETTENSINYSKNLTRQFKTDQTNITNAISFAACTIAAELKTGCICSVTKSGFTARMISKYRPCSPLVACTMDRRIWRQLNLVWGCRPVFYDAPLKNTNVFEIAMESAMQSGVIQNGDTVVMAIGVPIGVSGSTNTLRVEIAGNVLAKGFGVGTKRASGKARVVQVHGDAEHHFQKGDILVTTTTDNDLMPYIKKAAAIIVGPLEHPENSHAEIVGQALDIPVVICNAMVVDFIPDDTLITVDAQKGFVYSGIPE